MPLEIIDDEIRFSSGRTAYANCGIIGLSPGSNQVSYGYDGALNWPPEDYHETKLTPEDMRELADHMIAAWQAFKANIR